MDDFRGLLASGATEPWSYLDGLRNKYFTLYGDDQGAGFYTWTSKDSLETYMKSELW